jgi:hypothetical protein
LGDCDVGLDDGLDFGDEFEFKVCALIMDVGEVAFPIIVLVDEFLKESHTFYFFRSSSSRGDGEECTSVLHKRVVFSAVGSQTGDTKLEIPD